MDLSFTDREQAFRAECRAWLQANVPTEDLGSHNTAEGFARHLDWERALFEALEDGLPEGDRATRSRRAELTAAPLAHPPDAARSSRASRARVRGEG